MPVKRLRHHACERKAKYLSESDATLMKQRLFDSDEVTNRHLLQVYHCGYGDHWHVGHKRSRKPRRST